MDSIYFEQTNAELRKLKKLFDQSGYEAHLSQLNAEFLIQILVVTLEDDTGVIRNISLSFFPINHFKDSLLLQFMVQSDAPEIKNFDEFARLCAFMNSKLPIGQFGYLDTDKKFFCKCTHAYPMHPDMNQDNFQDVFEFFTQICFVYMPYYESYLKGETDFQTTQSNLLQATQ